LQYRPCVGGALLPTCDRLGDLDHDLTNNDWDYEGRDIGSKHYEGCNDQDGRRCAKR
jgi:hypothetical protein